MSAIKTRGHAGRPIGRGLRVPQLHGHHVHRVLAAGANWRVGVQWVQGAGICGSAGDTGGGRGGV